MTKLTIEIECCPKDVLQIWMKVLQVEAAKIMKIQMHYQVVSDLQSACKRDDIKKICMHRNHIIFPLNKRNKINLFSFTLPDQPCSESNTLAGEDQKGNDQ